MADKQLSPFGRPQAEANAVDVQAARLKSLWLECHGEGSFRETVPAKPNARRAKSSS